MWLGPPYMNKKMTLLHLAGKCGRRGASGLVMGGPSARRLCRARNSSPNIAAKATDMKPPPDSQRNSRRVRPQKFRKLAIMILPPVDVSRSQDAPQARNQ